MFSDGDEGVGVAKFGFDIAKRKFDIGGEDRFAVFFPTL